jgi:hypothetical protein
MNGEQSCAGLSERYPSIFMNFLAWKGNLFGKLPYRVGRERESPLASSGGMKRGTGN